MSHLDAAAKDTRTPSPPWGYSCPCRFDRQQQIDIVAQFHAHGIQPGRIAYRMGIDIAFVEALITGEAEVQAFNARLQAHRKSRLRQRLQSSAKKSGNRRYEEEQALLRDFQREQQNQATV
ncbi:MAG: hypothetical protein CSA53_04570 [Gammaproteobacteria bacterium]|nr:MAG: hypothetical protein CSA53_04570 [Gammaproteobacteria bacterium]